MGSHAVSLQEVLLGLSLQHAPVRALINLEKSSSFLSSGISVKCFKGVIFLGGDCYVALWGIRMDALLNVLGFALFSSC